MGEAGILVLIFTFGVSCFSFGYFSLVAYQYAAMGNCASRSQGASKPYLQVVPYSTAVRLRVENQDEFRYGCLTLWTGSIHFAPGYIDSDGKFCLDPTKEEMILDLADLHVVGKDGLPGHSDASYLWLKFDKKSLTQGNKVIVHCVDMLQLVDALLVTASQWDLERGRGVLYTTIKGKLEQEKEQEMERYRLHWEMYEHIKKKAVEAAEEIVQKFLQIFPRHIKNMIEGALDRIHIVNGHIHIRPLSKESFPPTKPPRLESLAPVYDLPELPRPPRMGKKVSLRGKPAKASSCIGT